MCPVTMIIHCFSGKDQSNLLYPSPNIDTMQYAGANNEDTNQTSDHTSEVRDSHFHSDGAF